MSLKVVSVHELTAALHGPVPPLLLDARRSESLKRKPRGIPSAFAVLLDEPTLRIPRRSADRPIVVYCLCSGQASSTRVALTLLDAGYDNVGVLEGGLPRWESMGLPLAPLSVAPRDSVAVDPRREPGDAQHLIAERTFLAGVDQPVRRDMAVLFVDMVDSTELVFSRSPEDVLRLVQSFMEEVVGVAVTHCGDVHDFEGDGAMLYFAGVGEALPAAFDLQRTLGERRRLVPDLPQARIALDAGPLVVGYVGTRARRGLSFVGPSVNTAARILKLAPPGGIVATYQVVTAAMGTDPDLVSRLMPLPEQQQLKGIAEPVTVFVSAPEAPCPDCDAEARSEPFP